MTRRQSFTFNFGPRLVIYQDVVLYSGGDGQMISVDSKSGKQLWDASFPNSGYQSPQDLMVVGGLVWWARQPRAKIACLHRARSPHGRSQEGISPGHRYLLVSSSMLHRQSHQQFYYSFANRCRVRRSEQVALGYSSLGTWRLFVRRDAMQWLDLHSSSTIAPAIPKRNSNGFNALAPLAPTRPLPATVAEAGRLEKGPAFGRPNTVAKNANSDDWPTYRHDTGRNGTTKKPIPAELTTRWNTQLGGQLTPPVIADGMVFCVANRYPYASRARRSDW